MLVAARTLLLLALLAVIPVHATTPAPTLQTLVSGQVIEEGLAVAYGPSEDKSAPNTAAGRTSIHDEFRFVRKTDLVPAKLGIAFGFSYKLSGLPAQIPLAIEIRSIHPPMKGPDGRVRTVSTAQLPVDAISGQYEDSLVYVLSEPFEVLPGKWILQILFQGRELISREFTLE